jgi:large subunit ribosomal protein L19
MSEPTTIPTVERFANLKPGQLIRVHQKIKELNTKGEEKERIQMYEGIIIAKHGGRGANGTITVRKVSNGVGVERIFPLFLPTIAEIEVVKQYRTKRAKLYHLKGYTKKLREVPIKAA